MTDDAAGSERLAELGSIAACHVARPVAVARLLELLADQDPGVRAHVAGVAGGYLEDAGLLARVLELAGTDRVTAVRAAALEALGAVVRAGDLAGAHEPGYAPEPGEPDPALAGRAFELLRVELRGADPKLRRAALVALSARPDREVLAAIDALWRESEDDQVRGLALLCMGRTGDARRFAGAVCQGLSHVEPEVRLAAVEAAGAAEVLDALPRLEALLESQREPHELRAAAASALEAFGARAAAALVAAAESDPDEEVRAAARAALPGV